MGHVISSFESWQQQRRIPGSSASPRLFPELPEGGEGKTSICFPFALPGVGRLACIQIDGLDQPIREQAHPSISVTGTLPGSSCSHWYQEPLECLLLLSGSLLVLLPPPSDLLLVAHAPRTVFARRGWTKVTRNLMIRQNLPGGCSVRGADRTKGRKWPREGAPSLRHHPQRPEGVLRKGCESSCTCYFLTLLNKCVISVNTRTK